MYFIGCDRVQNTPLSVTALTIFCVPRKSTMFAFLCLFAMTHSAFASNSFFLTPPSKPYLLTIGGSSIVCTHLSVLLYSLAWQLNYLKVDLLPNLPQQLPNRTWFCFPTETSSIVAEYKWSGTKAYVSCRYDPTVTCNISQGPPRLSPPPIGIASATPEGIVYQRYYMDGYWFSFKSPFLEIEPGYLDIVFNTPTPEFIVGIKTYRDYWTPAKNVVSSPDYLSKSMLEGTLCGKGLK